MTNDLDVDALIESQGAECASDRKKRQHLLVFLVYVIGLEGPILEELLCSLHISQNVLISGIRMIVTNKIKISFKMTTQEA